MDVAKSHDGARRSTFFDWGLALEFLERYLFELSLSLREPAPKLESCRKDYSLVFHIATSVFLLGSSPCEM